MVMFGSGMGNAKFSFEPEPSYYGNRRRLKGVIITVFERTGRDGRPCAIFIASILQKLGVETDRFSTSSANLESSG